MYINSIVHVSMMLVSAKDQFHPINGSEEDFYYYLGMAGNIDYFAQVCMY